MLIKNTNASCQVIKTQVNKARAYIHLVISSTKPAIVNKVYRFYVRENNVDELLSSNYYWIDRNNNYNNDTSNIDINMYKEIILEVDITKQNTGKMQDRKWVRDIQLVLMEENTLHEQVWISPYINLVSQEIELPEIKELNIYSTEDYNKMHVELKYLYTQQADFNYNNDNLFTRLSVYSNTTQKLLETANVYEENSLTSTIHHTFTNRYTNYVEILIELCSMSGEPLLSYRQLYKPFIRRFKTYAKINGQIKQVTRIYVHSLDGVIE